MFPLIGPGLLEHVHPHKQGSASTQRHGVSILTERARSAKPPSGRLLARTAHGS